MSLHFPRLSVFFVLSLTLIPNCDVMGLGEVGFNKLPGG